MKQERVAPSRTRGRARTLLPFGPALSRAVRDLDRTVALPLLRFTIEWAVLGRWPVFAPVVRRVLGRRLVSIRPWIDRDFYVRQQASKMSRRAAETDAALHYYAIGRFHNLAPNPDFDPIAYREHNTHLGWIDDPLADLVAGRGHRPPRPASLDAGSGRAAVVTLHHARGGGSAHYLDLLEAKCWAEGHRVVRLARVSLGAPLFRAVGEATSEERRPVFDLRDCGTLARMLRSERAQRLVVNHIIDLPPAALPQITEACRKTGTAFEVHLHDYLYLCPRINLIDGAGRYCGAPRKNACPGCALKSPDGTVVSRTAWRDLMHAFLGQADRLVAPSRDTAERYARHWPDLPITVWHPDDDTRVERPLVPLRKEGQPVRVAVLGRLNVPKGFGVLLALARVVKERRLPIEFVLIGQSIDDKALRRAGVTVHGRYRPDQPRELLDRYAPHLVFMPAIWPETWSFVLSLVLEARLPVCAFDLGAPAERLRELGFGHILPTALADDADGLADELFAIGRAGSETQPTVRRASVGLS